MIKALIPVRSGSVRVKNKNLRPFADSNLLSIKIEQMKRIKGIDGIIVNSNSDEMLNVAKSLGVDIVKRDEYFASNMVSMNEVYQNMAENCDCDTIIMVDATNPLIEDKTIEQCIESYFSNIGKFDSLATVSQIKQFMWLDNKPLNYDVNNKPKSQDLPDIVALNHAVCIIPRQLMISNRDVIGHKPFLYKVDSVEGIDIDDNIDFEFAEFLYKKYRIGENT